MKHFYWLISQFFLFIFWKFPNTGWCQNFNKAFLKAFLVFFEDRVIFLSHIIWNCSFLIVKHLFGLGYNFGILWRWYWCFPEKKGWRLRNDWMSTKKLITIKVKSDWSTHLQTCWVISLSLTRTLYYHTLREHWKFWVIFRHFGVNGWLTLPKK